MLQSDEKQKFRLVIAKIIQSEGQEQGIWKHVLSYLLVVLSIHHSYGMLLTFELAYIFINLTIIIKISYIMWVFQYEKG